MAFPQDTIRLGTARKVFTGIKFVEIRIGATVVGYRAIFPDGSSYEEQSLTTLCSEIWQEASGIKA